MVPPVHMQMLYAKAAAHNNRCTFVEYPTGKHRDTWLASGDRYWRTILQFLEQNVPEKRTRGVVRFLSESLEFLLLKAHILQPFLPVWS